MKAGWWPFGSAGEKAPRVRVQISGDLNTKGLANSSSIARKQPNMAYSAKSSADADEGRKYQDLEDRFVELANNERGLAEAYHDSVHIDELDRTRGEVLAAEEEQVLRCLGAAVIMQWNTLPTSLQREIFDTAGSVGKLWETAALRGQIARFLHKHNNESRRVNLPLTDDTAGDARSSAAALSRWDNEGGAVRDGLPT